MPNEITIRNLENHEVFHFNEPIWSLRYDSQTMIFSCDDFRCDQWLTNDCRIPLKVTSSLFPELDEGYVFETDLDARIFLGWLQSEAHPAWLRMCRAS